MNAGEPMQQEPRPSVPTRAAQGTIKSDAAKTILGKALDALFKAQEHLNAVADQGDANLSKVIDGITHNLRGLQREVSQVIYRIDKDGHQD